MSQVDLRAQPPTDEGVLRTPQGRRTSSAAWHAFAEVHNPPRDIHRKPTDSGTVLVPAFLDAGRPILAGGAEAGLSQSMAWIALMAISLLPLLPLVYRRAHWAAHATLGLFSSLLVLVLIGDLARVRWLIARLIAPERVAPLPDPRALQRLLGPPTRLAVGSEVTVIQLTRA